MFTSVPVTPSPSPLPCADPAEAEGAKGNPCVPVGPARNGDAELLEPVLAEPVPASSWPLASCSLLVKSEDCTRAPGG